MHVSELVCVHAYIFLRFQVSFGKEKQELAQLASYTPGFLPYSSSASFKQYRKQHFSVLWNTCTTKAKQIHHEI